MSGWTRFLLWAVAIFIVCYAFNINLPALIGGLLHGLQQVHNTNARHG